MYDNNVQPTPETERSEAELDNNTVYNGHQ